MSYQNGKVYRINCEDHFYFGSCITSVSRRGITHRYRAKSANNKLYAFISDKEWTICLVKDFPCNSMKELREEEDKYIKDSLSNPLCLNERSSIWDKDKDSKRKKQWYEANKERISQKNKEVYAEDKDNILKRNKAYRHKKNAEKNAEILHQA
jgi:hypothetical protein